MKILLIEWDSYGRKDIKEAFTAEGHQLVCFPFDFRKTGLRHDPEVEEKLHSVLRKETPDAVFSIDFFPVISKVCRREQVRYISWTYDWPHILLYSATVIYPCNTVYVFDKEVYQEFHNAGIPTVHYMPLAANTERLDTVMAGSAADTSFACDISFVGSLYVENYNLIDEMMPALPNYVRGYLDALMAAQLKIYGYNFIEELLSPVVNELQKAYPMELTPDGLDSLEHNFAQYVINRRITAIERMDLLEAVAEKHTVDLFTHVKELELPNICNHGEVNYDYEMPLVFKQSKINLNITLRSIKSGIPLRAIDIMGCGGFLLSNFQSEFLDFFVPGEDFVFYDSKEDLLRKIDYYLCHDDERRAIARNGHDKIAAGHTYRHRIREMFAE